MHPDIFQFLVIIIQSAKKNTKETKPISYMHYSKKKKLTGFIPLIPSYPTKKKLCYKRESMYPLITYTLFYCIDSPPLAWQNCNVEACPSQYKWHLGDWGKCSKTCGGGLKRRTKKCAGKDMISTSWKLCKGHEPVTKMK